MKRRLFVRVFVVYFLIAGILSAFISIASYQVITYRYRIDISAVLENLCLTTSTLISPVISDTKKDIQKIIDDIPIDKKTRLVIFDAHGNVRADTGHNPDSLIDVTTSRPYINAVSGIVGTYSDFDSSGREKLLNATAPIRSNNVVLGVVMASLPVDTVFMSITPLVFISFSVIILFFAVVGAVIFSTEFLRPIEDLSHAAKRVAEGDFSSRVFLNRNDEIKELADRFNFMTERLDFLFHQVHQQKEEVLAIISSLDEGLLVIGKDDRIVLFNDSFKKISQETPVAGKYYWETIRNLKTAELIGGVKRDGLRRTDEIEIDGRVYACVVTPIYAKDEIVVAFHDVNDIKNLQQLKKEFVSNVSHELRTPLTAIKGFIETIGMVDEKKKSYYIDIIMRNTDRMISIINDLLILSEYEEREVTVQWQPLDVEEMVGGIMTMFEKAIHEKGLTFRIVVEERPMIIKADPFKLEQLFINLIDNAVKYTQKGGITVSLSRSDTEFTAEVIDTGIGIPANEIPRIFDRFYRIDKSRSRAMGGTGLGLSIVKYIVLIHNGSIQVESREGEGSRFIFRLPQNAAEPPEAT